MTNEWWWDGTSIPALERSVLGSLLIVGESLPKVERVVSAPDFGSEPNRCVWEAIVSVAASGAVPDMILVIHELDRQRRLERAGGWAYVTSLVDAVPNVEMVVEYAKRVKEAAVLRRVRPPKGGVR